MPLTSFLPEAPPFSQQTATQLNPDISPQKSVHSDLQIPELFSKDIFSLEDDNSLLILLTEGNVRQLPFRVAMRETLPLIPLLWITKTSDIREGNTIEMQIELPITTRYEELERSWITSRIFLCSWSSYPSLPKTMQLVPYVWEISPFYLHLIAGVLYCKYEQLTRFGKLEFTNQGPCQVVKREILPVIPLLWITKASDIREGNRIEIQIAVPIASRYEDLERSWITAKIFECSWSSNPSLPSKMQIVPYVWKKSPFYLHLIVGVLCCKYEQLTRVGKLEFTKQGPFQVVKREIQVVKREILLVIPLPWITKASDIREGNRIEMQIGVPIMTRYEELERSWITARIFECSWSSYPSLPSKMQIVPYVWKKSLFYLHLIVGALCCKYEQLTRAEKLKSTNYGPNRDVENKDSEICLNNVKTGQVTADKHTIKSEPNSENRISNLPSTDNLEVNWSLIAINIKEMHLTSLLVEDGDYKKLYKGYYGDTHFVASDYRRIPKKLDMNDLGRLRSPNLPELFGIFQYNSHRWVIYVEAKFGDLHTLLKKDPHRTVFGEDSAKFVTVRLLSAIAYLQTHGVVHGDIRPSKILVNNLGMPMLGGLETVAWPSNKMFVRKSPKSLKIGFLAPEVLTGFRPQHASDIFSLGCVAYFIITGRRPFTKRSELLNEIKGPELLDIKLSLAGRKSIGRRFQLGTGLKHVRQNKWFADMDIDRDFSRNTLMNAFFAFNKTYRINVSSIR
ncbi:hypothetical protein CHS0354_019682 [Potamilus streckersoni]|uniref:non-specific serine/threonine protein kinase n=1 Tax=Potamilus streckersoni TaxID=2493646 RepID=A0AAE0S9I3_9BIVA|nr:hypothetical protein CHS0354_019682 [Potamilus streckersoni]